VTSVRIRVGAICREGDSVLLVEHEKDHERYWLFPGGGIEVDETAEDALVRELLEETSVKVSVGRPVCICESISPNRERHIVHFLYETKRVSGSPGKSRDPRVRRSEFVPAISLKELTLYPPIQDWLMRNLSGGFAGTPEYLGAMWV
jgi:8-oxo-dGTP diphosphatase